MSSPTLYDLDFHAWTQRQSGLLRAGRVSEADLEQIAEEIESMGRREKCALMHRFTALLRQLPTWPFQPMRQGPSWRLSIANTRDALADQLADNPSLRSRLDDGIATACRRARRDAALETGLAETGFPSLSPWTAGRIMAEAFWP